MKIKPTKKNKKNKKPSTKKDKACNCCKNSKIDGVLNFTEIGKLFDGNHSVFFKSGNGEPLELLFELGKNTICSYKPKYCPECGKKLKI